MKFPLLHLIILLGNICVIIGRWPPGEPTLKIRAYEPETNQQLNVEFFAIFGNPTRAETRDNVAIKFQQHDGLHVTEVFDWVNDLHAVRVIVLGEIARDQLPYQQICFINKLGNADVLSAESIVRLRQKNSFAVQLTEDDRGDDSREYSLLLPVDKIPLHLKFTVGSLCSSSFASTDVRGFYMTETDYEAFFKDKNVFVRNLTSTTSVDCDLLDNSWNTFCRCSLKYSIPWYPCGWKYCNDGSSPSPTNIYANSTAGTYKCGVKTCRIRRQFYFEYHKNSCNWISESSNR